MSDQQLTPGTWTIDAAHSELGFVARHMMVSKVRGGFSEVEGTVVAAEDPTQSTAEATVQMTSIHTKSTDRDNHLRGADFFDVENHPVMSFKSTAFTGDSLTGDLTIKGVTKPVTFDVEFGGTGQDPWGNTKAGFEATAKINRKDWGLTWNAVIEGGGVLVSDNIDLVLDIQLLKQA